MNKAIPLTSDFMTLWTAQWQVETRPLYLMAGDLVLVIERLLHEWQLGYSWQKLENQGHFQAGFELNITKECEHLSRIAVECTSCTLKLIPKLADRPVVVRPYSPLTIPANNKITLFVTTPLWVAVCLGGNTETEFPLQQLSETWMGALTGQGSLCYGSHTHARLDKSLLQRLPYRAQTPVTIDNQSTESLTLERLSIPAPYLSLYQGNGQLVTEPLYFSIEPKNHQGSIRIEKPDTNQRVSGAREKTEKGILTSTWENLFA